MTDAESEPRFARGVPRRSSPWLMVFLFMSYVAGVAPLSSGADPPRRTHPRALHSRCPRFDDGFAPDVERTCRINESRRVRSGSWADGSMSTRYTNIG